MAKEMLDTTHLLLPLPIPVNGSINGEKDNRRQALHDTPHVGCTVRPFRGTTDSDWYSDNLVITQGEAEKVKVASRTEALKFQQRPILVSVL